MQPDPLSGTEGRADKDGKYLTGEKEAKIGRSQETKREQTDKREKVNTLAFKRNAAECI